MYKKTTLSILLALLCTIAIIYIKNPEITSGSIKEFNYTSEIQEIVSADSFIVNLSEYYNLTGSQIYIDNMDPDYNWAKTAAENEWCSGSGTWNDPYIIENVFIDGRGNIPPIPGKTYSENCLTIFNSEVYFIVRNCFFNHTGMGEYNSGIFLKKVKHGIIYNNTINYCFKGIYVNWYSFNNTIYQNRLISSFTNDTPGGKAIYVAVESRNTTIYDNYILNYYDGIHVSDSNYVTVDKNFVRNMLFGHETETGIYIDRSNYCRVLRNVLSGDCVNVTVEFPIDEEGCTGNIFENNTVVYSEDLSHRTDIPHTQGTFKSVVSLAQSNYNTIAHNRYVIETGGEDTPPESIPGYHILPLIGLMGIITVFIIVRKRKTFQKRNFPPSLKCLFLSFFSFHLNNF